MSRSDLVSLYSCFVIVRSVFFLKCLLLLLQDEEQKEPSAEVKATGDVVKKLVEYYKEELKDLLEVRDRALETLRVIQQVPGQASREL